MSLFKRNLLSPYQDVFVNIYPELINTSSDEMCVKTVTIIVTQDCNLRCSYCYLHNKNCNSKMTLEMGKKIVDLLFEDSEKETGYVNKYNSQALIIDFIGGEPLMEIELIEGIMDYFKYKAITLNHRWALHHMVSLTTNGVLYHTEPVQRFLKKHGLRTSMTITIDGNKQLHDSCRVFPNGEGSYDIVERAVKDHLKRTDQKSTKVTLAPENIQYLFEATTHLYSLGLVDIFANCVFEQGWTIEHAKVLYSEMKKLADWLIEDNRFQKVSNTLFDETIGKLKDEDDNKNWCGGTGIMLAFDHKGDVYPCLRYVKFSLKDEVEPLVIGDIEHGLGYTEKQQETIKCLQCVTRRSQSTDECFYCPIGSGCAWCSAYNYEMTGSVDKRVTFICIMHKARVLANVYYWNTLRKLFPEQEAFPMNVPKEWALEIIDEDEYNKLVSLAK